MGSSRPSSRPDDVALQLYAAVLDGEPLVETLDAMRTALGAASAWISRLSFDQGKTSGIERFEHIGIDPAASLVYARDWVQLDPWITASRHHTPGVRNYDSLIAHDDYVKTPFWNDFARHQDIAVEHVVAADVAESDSVIGAIAFQRMGRAGPFGAAEERYLEAVYPHFKRALTTEARLGAAGFHSALTEASLDSFRHGIAILRPDHRPIVVNATLSAWIAQKDGLTLTRTGLVATEPKSQVLLAQRIEYALAAARNQISLANAEPFPIRRRSGGAWMVQVLALNGKGKGPFGGYFGALVLVSDVGRRHLPRRDTVQALLGLTRAEADLALALANGLTMADHAAQRGIGLETLRTHLANIRRKTDCRRQSDLVLLVASLAQ